MKYRKFRLFAVVSVIMSVIFLCGCGSVGSNRSDMEYAAEKLIGIAEKKDSDITLTDVRKKGGHISDDYDNSQIDDMRMMVNDYMGGHFGDIDYYVKTCSNLSQSEVEELYYALSDRENTAVRKNHYNDDSYADENSDDEFLNDTELSNNSPDEDTPDESYNEEENEDSHYQNINTIIALIFTAVVIILLLLITLMIILVRRSAKTNPGYSSETKETSQEKANVNIKDIKTDNVNTTKKKKNIEPIQQTQNEGKTPEKETYTSDDFVL